MASSKFGDDSQVKFFYNHKFIGSSDPDNIDCPALIDLMESDKDAATQILNYMNHLGDPVFPVSDEDWGTPETDIDNVDIWELYSEFMKELDYEYADDQALGFGFLVDADFQPWDFEIFDGPVAEENVVSTTKIKASRYDNVPGYKAPTGGYLYIFKHGIGPGTMPDDVHIVRVKDLPNGYTAVWLSDFLTTDELKKYDIPAETEINRYLNRIGYCQKKGDVVPCTADPYGFDDVIGSCDKKPVEAATDTDSEPDFDVTRLVEQFFTEVQELVEYFRYHNKNLNKRQDELIENLSDAFDSRSTTAAREAIENLNYNTRGMYKAQEYYVTDLYAELCYADGKYSGLGRTYADDAINGSTKYTADMCSVGASDDGYAQLAEGDDADTEEYIENGKYYVAGYLQSSYRGLMEDMYSDDFEEILTNAADMAGQGLYVEITNRADGRSERYTPEDFEEAASNGEYPDHIREDLAL